MILGQERGFSRYPQEVLPFFPLLGLESSNHPPLSPYQPRITAKTMMSAYTEHETIQVLIVGAGIGGLTLANICKRLGLRYLVLERSAAVTPVGAGISLAPNCLRVLDQLGFLPEIEREGQRLRKIRIFRNTTQWNMLDFDSTEKTFGYPVYKIERHAFHSALYRVAGEEHVLLGAQVVDVVDDAEKKLVTVTLADGREIPGQIVVGADGIRSATRRALAKRGGETIINSTIRFTGRTHMSGYTAPLEHLGPEEEGVGTWMLYDDSIFTTWPCKDKRQWFIGVQVRGKKDSQEPPGKSRIEADQAIVIASGFKGRGPLSLEKRQQGHDQWSVW